MDKARELKKIAQDLLKSNCPLRATATNPVPGEGNPNANLFFIGEAPGKKEDETGRPFVGAAGRVLEELLAAISLNREDVFITSIEKFRPPNNRDPEETEIMACFPFLEKQIKVIQPKIIICLGRHALRRMLEWEKGETMQSPPPIGKLHGKAIIGRTGRVYFPVYHPAAALYGTSRQVLIDDFKKIPIILKKHS